MSTDFAPSAFDTPVRIYVAPTFIKFTASPNGTMENGINIGKFMSNNLYEKEYIPRFKSYMVTNRYCYYNKQTNEAYLPRYVLPLLQQELHACNVELIDLEPFPARNVNIQLKKNVAPRGKQQDTIDFILDYGYFKPVSASCGDGKAQPISCPIRTPDGVIPVGKLQVGDTVLAWDGKPSKVLGIFPQGIQSIYRVSFADGRYFDVTKEHLWTIVRKSDIEKYKLDRYTGVHNYGVTVDTISLITECLNDGIYIPCAFDESNEWLEVVGVASLCERDECVCIAIDHPDKLYIAGDNIVTHNTVMSILSISYMKMPAVIILGSLIPQWYKSFKQFTKLSSEDIYVVQGIDPLKKLWEAAKKGYRPKVVIFSTRTLVLYTNNPKGPYAELPSYFELQKKLGIGVSVWDEVHLNFHANVLTMLNTCVRKNIFLSATYMRSSPQGKRIFDSVFPPDLRFGDKFRKKYTTVNLLRYSIGIRPDEMSKFKRQQGYMHALYEGYLLKHSSLFNEFVTRVLRPVVEMYYLNVKKDKQRLLILCQTKDFTIKIADYVSNIVGRLKVSSFFSSDGVTINNLKKLESDVIVSTLKSCGTGRDISMLKTCINTVSYSSEPLTNQVLGRLRELPGDETVFVDLWNRDILTHFYHYRARLTIYKTKAKIIHEATIC